MKKKILIIAVIVAIIILLSFAYSYFLKYFNVTKKNIDFYGCQTNLSHYYIKQGFHCGDLQEYHNYNEHVIIIRCLCEKYNDSELSSKLDEYIDLYAVDLKDRLMQDSANFYNHTTDKDKEYYGYSPSEKPPLCFIRRAVCM